MPSTPITIVLADDHTILRNGLRMLLESEADLHVVSEAGSVQAVFAAMSPSMKIVVLTMEHDPLFMRQAHDAGASGYVLKDSAATELVRTIRMAVGRRAREPR
jgi:two-component system response regulator NreC